MTRPRIPRNNDLQDATSALERAILRLEDKVDQAFEKQQDKNELQTQRMEQKIELVQGELRVSEQRRSELYLTRPQVEEKVGFINDRIDKEVLTRIETNRQDISAINIRLNSIMLAVILSLISTVVALLQTIFKFIPQVNT